MCRPLLFSLEIGFPAAKSRLTPIAHAAGEISGGFPPSSSAKVFRQSGAAQMRHSMNRFRGICAVRVQNAPESAPGRRVFQQGASPVPSAASRQSPAEHIVAEAFEQSSSPSPPGGASARGMFMPCAAQTGRPARLRLRSAFQPLDQSLFYIKKTEACGMAGFGLSLTSVSGLPPAARRIRWRDSSSSRWALPSRWRS